MKIYLGFDSRESLAYEVAAHSILARTSYPVEIEALELSRLGHLLSRPIERRGNQLWCPISNAPMATEFAISRFCVPFLQDAGLALFCDCDILCLADISELFALADERYAVQVVKHKVPYRIETTKMDGQMQIHYPRKLWSSVILWNCSHLANRRLTKHYLNTWPGRDLHAFHWLRDGEIGDLPKEWNFLVGIDRAPENQIKLLHYTEGGPWFDGCQQCEFAGPWLAEHEALKRESLEAATR